MSTRQFAAERENTRVHRRARARVFVTPRSPAAGIIRCTVRAVMRLIRGLSLIVLLSCVSAPPRAPAPPPVAHAPPLPGPPRVVVTLVVDQLAGWIASERWPELPKTGGFARLIREGTWVKQMRYAHAVTDTAPGHSSLYTAVTPRESGIFANEVPDGHGGRLSFLRDETVHLVSEAGEDEGPGASLAKLRVDTLADVLHRHKPEAVVVGLSLKDRGALFGAGRSPNAALWLEARRNLFVTAKNLASALPSWVAPVASARVLARVESQTWNLLDPPWVLTHAKTPDDQPGEADDEGLGVVFPHFLAKMKTPGYALRTSPFGDEMVFALALAAIDGEKIKGHDALLALSLSANDYIGHVFGPDSWEAWDELARLDRSLGKFLEALDARFGQDGYAVVLTADHGVTNMPEATLVHGVRGWCEGPDHGAGDPWGRSCNGVGRLIAEALVPELRAAAEKALGPGDWITGVIDPYVYLTPAARALEPRKKTLLDDALSRQLKSHGEVDLVTPKPSLPAECPPEADESVAALVCRSVAPEAGDYYVVTSRGSFFDPNLVVGKGSSHGSPYLFDRAVPLLARAPGRIAAGKVIETPVGYETFARAAAELLGIEGPGHASAGAVLVGREP
jgi:hypothetical protein